MESKKTFWIAIIIIILVVAGIYLLNLSKRAGQKESPISPINPVVNSEVDSTNSEPSSTVPDAVAKVPGGSLVKNEKVVTQEGTPVKNEALPGSAESPRQSHVLSEDEIPEDAIKLVVSKENGFKPSEFTVKEGEVVTISLMSEDGHTHVLKFKDASLRGIELTVINKEIRAVVFNAPKKGDYPFFCNVPGHTESGVMHVK